MEYTLVARARRTRRIELRSVGAGALFVAMLLFCTGVLMATVLVDTARVAEDGARDETGKDQRNELNGATTNFQTHRQMIAGKGKAHSASQREPTRLPGFSDGLEQEQLRDTDTR